MNFDDDVLGAKEKEYLSHLRKTLSSIAFSDAAVGDKRKEYFETLERLKNNYFDILAKEYQEAIDVASTTLASLEDIDGLVASMVKERDMNRENSIELTSNIVANIAANFALSPERVDEIGEFLSTIPVEGRVAVAVAIRLAYIQENQYTRQVENVSDIWLS
ncbi:MAG: hypothetical protein WC965_01645 [Thiohalomonadaceae bacterium]